MYFISQIQIELFYLRLLSIKRARSFDVQELSMENPMPIIFSGMSNFKFD